MPKSNKSYLYSKDAYALPVYVVGVEIQQTDTRYSKELIAEQGQGTDADIKYNILPSAGWTPYSVTLKIKQGVSEIRSKALNTNLLGEQNTTWDGKDNSLSYVGTGTYDATIEVLASGGITFVSNSHNIVVVDKIFKCWADADKTNLNDVVGETTESGLRAKWNSFVRTNAFLNNTETFSDTAINQGTTIPNTTLLDKILDIIADKETSAGGADGEACPFDIGPTSENSYGATQIRDIVMSDRGKTYQDNIDGDFAATTTIVSFGEYLNTLSTDERSDIQSCFEVTIDQMEWLDNYYVDVQNHGNYQLGDNRDSAEILAAGWNGGQGAIIEGFNGDSTWESDDIVNAAAEAYAEEIGERSYP